MRGMRRFSARSHGRHAIPALAALILAAALGCASALPQVRRWVPASDALPSTWAPVVAAWSFAGYEDGDSPLPFDKPRTSVGGKGDGKVDVTAALQAALDQGGVVALPKGTYRVTRPLVVRKAGVVLRGAGEGATRILVDGSGGSAFLQFVGSPESGGRKDTRLARVAGGAEAGSSRLPVEDAEGIKDGQRVRVFAAGRPELRMTARVTDSKKGWVELDRAVPFAAGGGSIHRFAPTVQDSGVERLTVEFNAPRYDAKRPGLLTAISFTDASDVWVKQVTVLNADSALAMERVDHASVLDLSVGTSKPRWADAKSKVEGARAVSLSACHAVLVARFRIASIFESDLSLDGSFLNVFTGGQADDLSWRHAGASAANLFSDTNAGAGRRAWEGAGSAGPLTAWWNVRPSGEVSLSTAKQGRRLAGYTGYAAAPAALPLPPCSSGGGDLAFVGGWSGPACDGWFVATLDPATMPTDLYSHALLERVTTPSLPESGASRPGALMAETACRTEMTPTGEDPLECWTLLFDHCISGYTSRNRVPRSILQNELQVLAALYDEASGDGNFGKPARPPLEYSRVCVADPAKAGKGDCKHVRKDDYRIHTFGFAPKGWGVCDHIGKKVAYVKAHVNGKHEFDQYGAVGH